MPFGVFLFEVPLLVRHMVVFKIVVVEVLVVLVVTHAIIATIIVGMQFFVPTIVDIPIVSLVALVALEKFLFVDISHTYQVDFDYVVY